MVWLLLLTLYKFLLSRSIIQSKLNVFGKIVDCIKHCFQNFLDFGLLLLDQLPNWQ